MFKREDRSETGRRRCLKGEDRGERGRRRRRCLKERTGVRGGEKDV